MSSTRILSSIIGTAAGYAAGGAIYGSVGAKVLQTAGYAGYSILGAVRAGAAGNAVMGGIVGAIKGCASSDDNKEKSFSEGLQCEALVNAAISSAGAALGYAMLKAATEMPLDKTVAAIATGAGVMAGAGAALLVVIAAAGICYTCAAAATAETANNPVEIQIASMPTPGR